MLVGMNRFPETATRRPRLPAASGGREWDRGRGGVRLAGTKAAGARDENVLVAIKHAAPAPTTFQPSGRGTGGRSCQGLALERSATQERGDVGRPRTS